MTANRLGARVESALLYALAGALFILVILHFTLAGAWNALTGPFVERTLLRRWQQSSTTGGVVPGTPAWAGREQRVADLIAELERLPVERFDTFEPGKVVDRTPLYEAAQGAPREVRTAVETAHVSASRAVYRRAERDRPEAGGEDYTLHNVWFLYEPHWVAAERAAIAGAIAILLEGHLDEKEVCLAAGLEDQGALGAELDRLAEVSDGEVVLALQVAGRTAAFRRSPCAPSQARPSCPRPSWWSSVSWVLKSNDARMTRWPFLFSAYPLLHQVWGHDRRDLGDQNSNTSLVALEKRSSSESPNVDVPSQAGCPR